MKKILWLSILVIFFSLFSLSVGKSVYAQVPSPTPPLACPDPSNPQSRGYCPGRDSGLLDAYTSKGERCPAGATLSDQYQDYLSDPAAVHLWVEDPTVTDQGKADDRARQFVDWALNKNAIDDHPVLTSVWNVSRNISYFFIILVAAIMGIGIIVGQRTNFQIKIPIWPSVLKLVMAILWITFSAAIVLLLIQLSELLMKFFIENLGGKDLFNIYFSASGRSSETNYVQFIGCRDLNIRVQEAGNTEIFMLKLTNITYYVMGVMVILRKILLWFLLFVSPFLAILMSFTFIRNIGFIWIGVFFQWLFYGPLFALFLGAMAKIWETGIPFTFDFSRVPNSVQNVSGYIYPTAINILYGGPAQRLEGQFIAIKNGNYIDTFAEYIISLIMLWAVIFFPWWLLRIFRDYCCDGIMAMKNILLSMYDQSRNGGGGSPPPIINPSVSTTGTTINTSSEVVVPIRIKLETIEEIKKAETKDIARSLNLSATRLSDVAQYEVNRQSQQDVKKNLEYLSNPMNAATPMERQKYMNIRSELFSRAVKEDVIAKQILSATSTSKVEQIQARSELLKSTPSTTTAAQAVSTSANVSQEKVIAVTSSLADSLSANTSWMTNLAKQIQVAPAQVQTVLSSFSHNLAQPPLKIISAIATETNLPQEKVSQVITQVGQALKNNKELAHQIAQKENLQQSDVEKLMEVQIPLVTETQKHIEKTISIPQTISIEDYEEVKSMWTKQYEKGEVPVTENIKTRDEWVNEDIVFITNTLNKLVATDDKLKIEGLDEVGYILPIFMINNLKGDELLVYLKAKLEAAKAVQKQIEKEQEITAKVKAKSEEELVDVDRPKPAEAGKTMEMKQELPTPEEIKAPHTEEKGKI